MYYLSEGAFQPLCIMINTPMTIFVILYLFSSSSFILKLIFTLSLLFFTLGMDIITYAICNSKRYYMLFCPDCLKIKYPNISKTSDEIILEYQNIKQIDFYGMTSIKAWAMLFNYICPNSVFVTYCDFNETREVFIGYLKPVHIRELKSERNLKVVIH